MEFLKKERTRFAHLNAAFVGYTKMMNKIQSLDFDGGDFATCGRIEVRQEDSSANNLSATRSVSEITGIAT